MQVGAQPAREAGFVQGAGGYGDPKARERALLARDVAEGKISARAARELYGYDEAAAKT